MTTLRVKICGIKSPAAFDATVEAGADYLGFNFFPASPRYVSPAEAASLSARSAGGPKRVGLFVNPSADEIEKILQILPLDILQIHAPASAIPALRARFGRLIWHALGIAQKSDFPGPADLADGYVMEAKPPPGATRPGGNATLADWPLLSQFRPEKPWLLAGGLSPGNVAEALRQTGAPGADVASGVETAPGEKSPELIKQFVAAVKGGT